MCLCVCVFIAEPGLQLEAGVYISKISPGSALAKEGNVAVGDRVLSVNNKSVETKSAKVRTDSEQFIYNSTVIAKLILRKWV